MVGFGVEGRRFWEEDRLRLALEYTVSSKEEDHKGQGWYGQHPNVVFNISVLASSSIWLYRQDPNVVFNRAVPATVQSWRRQTVLVLTVRGDRGEIHLPLQVVSSV